MKFIKKVTFLVLFLFVVNLIMPNVDVQAFVDSNTSKINSNEELGLIFQDEMSIEDVNFDSENISDEGEDVNNINEEKRSVGDEPVVIKLENPIENHKLTGSFFVKGWAVGLEGISEVNVYIDGKLYGQATYGITRNDIGSKYPQYINSTNSGFNMEIEGYQNGVHEVKVIAIDIKGQKAEAKVNISVDTTTTVIMSKGTLKREQMISYLLKRNPSKSQEYAEAFVDYTINESNIEGVNHDILFSQMMHETGFLKFGGDVKEEQNNFAGLGAVGNGVPGESFPTIQIGIRAVVQHLKAYASTEALVQECVDTRFKYVQRGTALYVEHLGIPENPKGKGWAASNSYGYKILKIRDEIAQEPINYISKITSFKTTGETVVGSKMTMIATATPEAETEYKFLVRDPSGYWKGLNDYSSKNSIEYTPTMSGAYRYVVHVKHKKSNAEYDELQVIDFTVSGATSKITSFKTTGEAVVGSKMTMIATATPEAETEYKFLVRDPSGYWKGLNDYSSKNSIEYTPTMSGAYRYVVHVKHKKSNAEYDELQVIDLYIDKNDVKKLIVIDPGHNYGGDNGATSTHNGVTYIERDLNMQVSLKLKDELEKKGFTVVLTRNPEDRETIAVSESLRKRVDLANKLQADFFISIHQNSYTDSSVRGFEVYYSDALPETRGVISSDGLEYSLNSLRTSETEKVKLSKKIGSSIVSSVTSEMGLKNRGLKNKDFYVVKNTTMPSLLVECGFISNPDEAKNLANEQKQQKMAEIIAREIGKNL
ncbi:N-acetylmuramoyl-L-alanine amidase [Clostridium disporicum]|uniref:N-acetylmuramoyl-L-alanine amidase n=11 Tax=Clostridiaceae TaxID=31979 RepID=UPI0006C5F675|nr:N-acetylmuramoyl-L-alanine amidase [Clostridium disporicum]CUO95671.1 N-acetylmuramoyl-L-alanine amidase [Clostridium disporicum]